MSQNGKRFFSSKGAGRRKRIRIYTLRRPLQERVKGEVRWPYHKILRYTREVYSVRK